MHEAGVEPRRHGLDGSAADEVFQEVWMALARQLLRLRRRRGLSKWLMTTAYRASCQWLRRNRSASPLEDGQAAVDAPSADNVEQWERHTVVNTALEALGPKCRELLVALYGGIDRPNYDDVARRVGMPRGSIGPTRARCLEQLTQILGRAVRCGHHRTSAGRR